MATEPGSIRVFDPLSQAFDRVGIILFRPFDIGKWFAIGFAAWLATLGEGGGTGGGGFGGPGGGSGSADEQPSFRETLEKAGNWIAENAGWLIPAALGVAIFFLAFLIAILWLSSRGKFMFLHNVAHNSSEIAVPWKAYSRLANSLWLFRIVLTFVSMILILSPLAGIAWVGIQAALTEALEPGAIALLILFGLFTILAVIAVSIVDSLTTDFVVPIMLRQDTGCLSAWGTLGRLLAGHPIPLILFLLLKFALGLAVGSAVFVLVLLTCCIAACLLAIPYLGTVAMLPVLVFFRAYSIHFLAQFGDRFDVFQTPRPGLALPS